MKNIIKLVVSGLAAVAMIAPAMGADEAKAEKKKKKAPNREAAYKKIDANSDGKVSLEEFTAALANRKKPVKAKAATRQFKRKDKDSDGNLTLAEFSARPNAKKKNAGDAAKKPAKKKGKKQDGVTEKKADEAK